MDNMILKSNKEEVEYEEILKKVVVTYLEERKTYDHTYKYSYDDIAIIVGISKYKVHKIAKEYSLTRRK